MNSNKKTPRARHEMQRDLLRYFEKYPEGCVKSWALHDYDPEDRLDGVTPCINYKEGSKMLDCFVGHNILSIGGDEKNLYFITDSGLEYLEKLSARTPSGEANYLDC